MHRFLAQSIKVGDQEIQGQLKLPGGKEVTLGNIINVVLPFVIMLCGILLFFIFIWAGYDFMLSRGEPGKIKAARAKMTYGIVGFVLLVLSYFIVNLISYMFGVGGGLFGR
ncbi:hypothetical protein HYS00_05255 [Candidatus Microgenomates bacterium]|nr:hypothetical protein [Candidatus Microgenomates bacterium]